MTVAPRVPHPFSSSDEPLGIFGDVMVSRSSASLQRLRGFRKFPSAKRKVSGDGGGYRRVLNTLGLLIAASPHAACR
jgi:hypothetical protein